MSERRDDEVSGNRGMTRREAVGLAAAGAAAAAVTARALAAEKTVAPAAELEETTLGVLQADMREGKITAVELVQKYSRRIQALDSSLHSVLELNPDAEVIAAKLDKERVKGRVRGPLHGIPVLIKDNIGTADRMQTTAGSLALLGARPLEDSEVAKRLREAGAVILGKTNLSEWANFRSTRSSSGWSARGGQCRNPYVLDRSPCGSSSGTGAAVSANLAAVGVGTETDGSVVCPSATCGIVGIKPTVGLVSRSQIVPISHSQDTAGPMARTVADAAVLLAAMKGKDRRDPATAEAPADDWDMAAILDLHGLEGARIGVAREKFFGYSPEADEIAEEAIKILKAGGAKIVDPADIPHAGEYDEAEMEVLLYEFKADLEAYMAALGPEVPVRKMAQLIEFNRRHASRELRFFGQELFEMAVEKGPLTDSQYLRALEACRRLSRNEGLDAVFKAHRLDAIVAPTGSPAWTIDLVNGDHFLGASSTPAAVSGYPSVTVPAGYSFGLPVGLTFIGRRWQDARLMTFAYAFEQAGQARRPPGLLPTARLEA